MIRPRVVLATCCLSLFLVTMGVTIVNLALPAIARDLHASRGGLQWAIDGYTVVIASFLILVGALADRHGRRRVFQIGLVMFTAASLLCSLAPTIELLVVFRVCQAVGGAMLNPVAMSILVNVFTEPRQRARAIGVWAGVVGLSMAIGPPLGGFLVEHVGWRAVFWINVPVGVLAIVLTRSFVPESRAETPRRMDAGGQVLLVVVFATLTTCLIEGRRLGWTSLPIVAGVTAVSIAAVAFVRHERRRADPLVDLRYFRSIPFATATVLAVIAFTMFGGALFLSSLYLQETRGLTPPHAGMCLLPIAGGLLVCSQIAGRLVAAGRARIALVTAGVAFAIASLLLVDLTVDTPLAQLLACYALVGVAFGFVNPPITTAAVSGMPRTQAGVAAAIASTSRQLGATLGVAVSGSIASTMTTSPTFAVSTRPFWWFMTAGGAAIVVLGLAATGARARRSLIAVESLAD